MMFLSLSNQYFLLFKSKIIFDYYLYLYSYSCVANMSVGMFHLFAAKYLLARSHLLCFKLLSLQKDYFLPVIKKLLQNM